MNYPIDAQEPLPEAVAKALWDYIDKHGPPPLMAESIEIVVNGQVVIVELFSVKETE